MCNHLEQGQLTLELCFNYFEGIENPPDQATMEAHVWPNRPARVVYSDAGKPKLATMRWGVWPWFADASKKMETYNNARADGLLTKATWKRSVTKRRCLLPATAFYEYDGPKGGKWEVRFTVNELPAFFFAGLWDEDPDSTGTRACTMVTTTPNSVVAKLHDRMPVILSEAGAREWLGHEPIADERVLALCAPSPSEELAWQALPPPAKKIKKVDLPEGGGELPLF